LGPDTDSRAYCEELAGSGLYELEPLNQ
jgi:hypothetical protein